jgi:hypothetical protein
MQTPAIWIINNRTGGDWASRVSRCNTKSGHPLWTDGQVSTFVFKWYPGFPVTPPFVFWRWPRFWISGVRVLYSDDTSPSGSPSFYFGTATPLGASAIGSQWVFAFFIQIVSGLLGHPPFILARLPQFCMDVHLEHLPCVRSGCPFLVFKSYQGFWVNCLFLYKGGPGYVLRSTWSTRCQFTKGVRVLYSNRTRLAQSPLLVFSRSHSKFVSQVSAFFIQMIPGFLGHPLSFWRGHLNLCWGSPGAPANYFAVAVCISYSNGTRVSGWPSFYFGKVTSNSTRKIAGLPGSPCQNFLCTCA